MMAIHSIAGGRGLLELIFAWLCAAGLSEPQPIIVDYLAKYWTPS